MNFEEGVLVGVPPRGGMYVVMLTLLLGFSLGTDEDGARFLKENSRKRGVITTASGLQYFIIHSEDQLEDSRSPKLKSPCVVHFIGMLLDGTEFDNSYKRGRPATFAPNKLVAGWREALRMMHAGDKWKLWIPSELGYGNRRVGNIPPGFNTVIFSVAILCVDGRSKSIVLPEYSPCLSVLPASREHNSI